MHTRREIEREVLAPLCLLHLDNEGRDVLGMSDAQGVGREALFVEEDSLRGVGSRSRLHRGVSWHVRSAQHGVAGSLALGDVRTDMLVSAGTRGSGQVLGEASRLGPARHGEAGRVHLGGDLAAQEGGDRVDVGGGRAVAFSVSGSHRHGVSRGMTFTLRVYLLWRVGSGSWGLYWVRICLPS